MGHGGGGIQTWQVYISTLRLTALSSTGSRPCLRHHLQQLNCRRDSWTRRCVSKLLLLIENGLCSWLEVREYELSPSPKALVYNLQKEEEEQEEKKCLLF